MFFTDKEDENLSAKFLKKGRNYLAKWWSVYSFFVLVSPKLLRQRPIAGSTVPYCPVEKRMPDCWSPLEPSTFKVRAKNYLRWEHLRLRFILSFQLKSLFFGSMGLDGITTFTLFGFLDFIWFSDFIVALSVGLFAGTKRKIVLQIMLHFILSVLMFSYHQGKLIILLVLWNFLWWIQLGTCLLFLL